MKKIKQSNGTKNDLRGKLMATLAEQRMNP